ncbi:MAG: CoA transferase [Candidatus Rokubacteria bacterium]|nr:CoA transferase [Candidatus Rokubacteria bacterium]
MPASEQEPGGGRDGPFTGLKVVELGEGTAAPYAAKLLGDFGAEVVKVEPPAGDPARRRGPFPGDRPDHERSGLFLYLNTNKRGLTLDPACVAARAVLDRLLGWADVFVTNVTPEQLRRYDVAPLTLRAAHPRLVVVTITPFGLHGPYAAWRGDELTTYAAGGLAYSTPGMPDAAEDLEREPPLHPACFVAETITGTVAATASALALFGRFQTDDGCHVDVSQQAAVAAIQQRDVTVASYTGARYTRLLDPRVIGRLPNFYLPCKDGYVAIAAPADAHWTRLVEAMGSPRWALDEKFDTGAARIANWQELRFRLIEWTMQNTGDEIYRIAESLRMPLFPFYSLRRMAESEHVRTRGTFVTCERDGVPFRMPGQPIRMSRSPGGLRRVAPRLGEHTWEILHDWLGYEADAIGRLRASGAA